MITLIVGRDRNGAIGKDNDIPWHAPEDLKFFQRETLGGAIIMGRNTWDSLPFKPLKNRLNIVVSSGNVNADHVFPSLDAAITFAESQGYCRIYGIGGHGIYKALIPIANRLLITEVDLEIEAPDTYFPDFEDAQWKKIGSLPLRDEAPICVADEYLRVQTD